MFQTFDTQDNRAVVAERVKAIRTLLAREKLDCILVPRSDEHQGEYVPASAERLRWISGFSGSAGLAVISKKHAVLFTDGRYSVQAKTETDSAIFEISLLPRPRIGEWLTEKLAKGGVAGFDPWLHTSAEIARLSKELEPKGIKLKPLSKNLIDKAWGKDRPSPPKAPVEIYPDTLAGKTAAEKIADVQKQLRDSGQSAAVLTLPDSICWLLNIRGSDVAHNPIVLAFAVVPATGKADLYVDTVKVTKAVKSHLAPVCKIFAAQDFASRLKALKAAGKPVRLDRRTAASAIERALGAKAVSPGDDPCILPKAIKTSAEIAGARAAHVRDGAAVARFLAWFDEWGHDGTLDEITAVKKLEDFRRETGALREISFPAIAGSGPNGAIVHYRVSEASNRKILPGELFLLDSGAQYSDGTTDITRTLAAGVPGADMKQHFTAVLKGHIAIATARFPKGTRGIDLDPFARRALWDIGADYDHGTGHGIGSFLSVHEGPQSISRSGMAELQPGMLISNEPGYYLENCYGIRIENVVLVTPFEKLAGGEREMMGFETLTFAPIDHRLIAREQLSASELGWLNAYHERVYETLAPHLDAQTKDWLHGATAVIA